MKSPQPPNININITSTPLSSNSRKVFNNIFNQNHTVPKLYDLVEHYGSVLDIRFSDASTKYNQQISVGQQIQMNKFFNKIINLDWFKFINNIMFEILPYSANVRLAFEIYTEYTRIKVDVEDQYHTVSVYRRNSNMSIKELQQIEQRLQ